MGIAITRQERKRQARPVVDLPVAEDRRSRQATILQVRELRQKIRPTAPAPADEPGHIVDQRIGHARRQAQHEVAAGGEPFLDPAELSSQPYYAVGQVRLQILHIPVGAKI